MAEVLDRRAFVGRERERARLAAALDVVRQGRGRTAIVAGEAGIGKSALLACFARDAAASGASILGGACLPVRGTELPYGPFVEILRDLIRATPDERLAAALGPARSELARLVPELRDRRAIGEDAGAERGSQARLFEAFLGAIERRAAQAPVVLVVEDVQWADQSTRDLVSFLVRSARSLPVLVILTARSDAGDDPATDGAFLAELERDDAVERIDLGPLERVEVAAQASALLGAPADRALVDELVRRTDGNPFFVEEIVRAGHAADAPVPPVLRDVVSARVRALSPGCREVLRAAAVAGRLIDDELLAAALGVPPRAIAGPLREALDAGVLGRVVEPASAAEGVRIPRHGFRHELVREVVDGDVFASERAALHGAFAEALDARAAAGGWVAAAEVALHWDEAGRPDRALEPTIEAARDAERASAFADAFALWQRATRLVELAPRAAGQIGADRGDLLERAAEAASLAGRYPDALAMVRAAIEAIGPGGDGARRAHLRDRLRWFLWESGDRAAAAAAVREALRELPHDVPSAALARALGQQAGIDLYAGRYGAARDGALEAVSLARAAGAPADEAFALGVLGWAEAVLGDVEDGIGRLRAAIRIAEGLGSIEGIALGASNLTSLLDRLGSSAEALATALEGYALTERLGIARTYGGLLLGFAAKAQLLLGRWDDADRSTAEGLALGPTGRAELWLLIGRGRLLACRGAFDEAAALLRRAREIDERLGQTEFHTSLLAASAELAVWAKRPADVVPVVDSALAIPVALGPPDPSLAWVAALGLRALADRASVARARHDDRAIAELVEAARAISHAVARAAGQRSADLAVDQRSAALAGLVEAEAARLRVGSEPAGSRELAGRWRELAGRWRDLGRPLHEAYALFRAGEALLAAGGHRDGAAEALAAAERIAVDLGAMPLRREIEILARHSRIAVDATVGAPTVASGTDLASTAARGFGFTPRELEVLTLVAGGWSNQQIAEALFITRKTASVHVSNILGKLGVGSRVEAAAIAHRIGLGAHAPRPPDMAAAEGPSRGDIERAGRGRPGIAPR